VTITTRGEHSPWLQAVEQLAQDDTVSERRMQVVHIEKRPLQHGCHPFSHLQLPFGVPLCLELLLHFAVQTKEFLCHCNVRALPTSNEACTLDPCCASRVD
jgi:hypothetical protein